MIRKAQACKCRSENSLSHFLSSKNTHSLLNVLFAHVATASFFFVCVKRLINLSLCYKHIQTVNFDTHKHTVQSWV